MTANVTGEQLEAQIAELEELIAADVAVWVAECLAADDGDATASAPRAGGGDGPPAVVAGDEPESAGVRQRQGLRGGVRGQVGHRPGRVGDGDH